ncbi:hypothetical protein [uncultured Chryseobacterium sp.]|uniref:hypothetical protein n=1 Tax=uncultured Chryseobacterium sp. TaxID=259322 RepID=UPI0025EE65B5|nr:hypothetical protein [uncultured Chryseobacterium sp.]
MENNKLPTREELKTYFETDKVPTQNQFAAVIDALKHKDDIPTNREVAILANSLASINNTYINYNGYNLDRKFLISLESKGEKEEIVTVENYNGSQQKKYFLGSAPYTVKVIDFPNDGLAEGEYYYLTFAVDQKTVMNKLFGNNLPGIPADFELANSDAKWFSLQINRQYIGRTINIIKTNIKFINNTGENIQYKADGSYIFYQYTAKDLDVNLYDVWDYLNFYYKADLRKSNKNVQCSIYNAENNSLLTTSYMYAGQNSETWGNQTYGIRNLRIECNYF